MTFAKKALHARVLVLVVAGWMILRVVGRPAEAATPSSAPRAATAASAASGLPIDLPLDRGDTVDGWALARGAIVVAVMLAVAGAVVLRTRFRWSAPPPFGDRKQSPWTRWLAPVAANRPLRVVQSSRLTPRASVHVLHWDDKEWLVGCTEHGIAVLGQRAPPEAAGDGGRAGAAPDLVHPERSVTGKQP